MIHEPNTIFWLINTSLALAAVGLGAGIVVLFRSAKTGEVEGKNQLPPMQNAA